MHGLHKFLLFHLLACLEGSAPVNAIINGEKAPENSMLYMVSVQDNNGHVCGGFLVSEDFVLTAAHCDDPELTSVVLGTHNLKEADNEKRRSIEERYTHPKYGSEGFANDIMLLKLSGKVQWNNRVQPIQLPRSEIHTVEDNEKCSVAGWGSTRTGHGSVDELRVADVSVINQQVCEQLWPGLPHNVICAGGYNTDKGFCEGDGGGPLVCDGIAVGIVSSGHPDCHYTDLPSVYTDVSKYLPWIKKILIHSKSHELCLSVQEKCCGVCQCERNSFSHHGELEPIPAEYG